MASVTIFDGLYDSTGALAVVMGDDSVRTESGGMIDIEVPDRALREISVSGVITDANGGAVSGQSVVLEKQLLYHTSAGNSEKWFKYDSETTDSDGKYLIPAEKNTVYRISVGKDIPVHSDSTWARDESVNIDLSVTLHSLQGKVLTESGKSAEGIYVTLKRLGGKNAFAGTDLESRQLPTTDAQQSGGVDESQPVATEETQPPASDGTPDSMDVDQPAQTIQPTQVNSTVQNATSTDPNTAEPTVAEPAQDPVAESAYSDQMICAKSDKSGLFTFSEICEGAYRIQVGRTGEITSNVVVTGDSFVNLQIPDEDVKIEKYRNQILSSDERAKDYGTELDLPGYLLPTPSPKPKHDTVIKPDYKGKRLFDGETVYTNYNYTLEDYASRQYHNVPRIPEKRYLELLNPNMDTTKGMKYLRVDEYRPVNEKEFIKLFQSMIESFCRAAGKPYSSSVLYGHGADMLNAAKKNKIDPIFLTVQTFLESAYGTSHLASGNVITRIALEGYPRTYNGKFLTKPLKTSVKVYNLYGIKAYDADPYVGGTSFAYYSGWTTPEKAIFGAAAYLKESYIHSMYHQNTAFKIRFNPTTLWHQYATGPDYAENLGKYMMGMAGVYSSRAHFTYDLPRYLPSNTKNDEPTLIDPFKQ